MPLLDRFVERYKISQKIHIETESVFEKVAKELDKDLAFSITTAYLNLAPTGKGAEAIESSLSKTLPGWKAIVEYQQSKAVHETYNIVSWETKLGSKNISIHFSNNEKVGELLKPFQKMGKGEASYAEYNEQTGECLVKLKIKDWSLHEALVRKLKQCAPDKMVLGESSKKSCAIM